MYLLFLDDYHLEDRLFIQGLARVMATALQQGRRFALIHGSGEEAERLLETEGVWEKRTEEVLPAPTPDLARLVERAHRDINRRLVATLTDAGVASVGLMGSDRRLIQTPDGVALTAHNPSWYLRLSAQGVVPVVAARAWHISTGQTVEVAASSLAITIAQWSTPTAPMVLFTRNNKPGLLDAQGIRTTCPPDDYPAPSVVPAAALIPRFAASGIPTYLTAPRGLTVFPHPQGTVIASLQV